MRRPAEQLFDQIDGEGNPRTRQAMYTVMRNIINIFRTKYTVILQAANYVYLFLFTVFIFPPAHRRSDRKAGMELMYGPFKSHGLV